MYKGMPDFNETKIRHNATFSRTHINTETFKLYFLLNHFGVKLFHT